MKLKEASFHKYLYLIAIVILVYFSYLIIKPFVVSIVSAFILAYLSRPAFQYLSPKVGRKVAAFLCVVIVSIIFIIPTALIVTEVVNQATDAIQYSDINALLNKAQSSKLLERFGVNLPNIKNEGLDLMISTLKDSILYLPSFLLSVLIILTGIYYLLLSWNTLSIQVEKYLPFKDNKRFKKEIGTTTNTIVYGTLLIALIQFIISLNAFIFLGIKTYLLLSALIFLLAFIPGLGPALVWIPLLVYYISLNNIFMSLSILVVGLILTILIDTLLRAKILGDITDINPMVMLIGLLGGIYIFGLFGFIIGPLILTYTIKLIKEIIPDNELS